MMNRSRILDAPKGEFQRDSIQSLWIVDNERDDEGKYVSVAYMDLLRRHQRLP